MIEKEKFLEKKLKSEVSKAGGWSIKLLPFLVAGLPDQMCLFPGGRAVFAEVKETGKKPTKLQSSIHRKIAKLGFQVWVVDSSDLINELIENNVRKG